MILVALLLASSRNYKFVFKIAETKNDDAMRVLVPPGKDPPTPLGGPTMSGTSYKATKRPELLLMCSVSTLMRCCCTMLTSSYPVQVEPI